MIGEGTKSTNQQRHNFVQEHVEVGFFTENKRKWAGQDFADANKPPRTVLVYRAIGCAVFIQGQPNQER